MPKSKTQPKNPLKIHPVQQLKSKTITSTQQQSGSPVNSIDEHVRTHNNHPECDELMGRYLGASRHSRILGG
jgi:hypothetical protein